MIKIKFLYEGKEHEINASGLGDLGWQLDGWGADSAGSDDDFTVISIELILTNSAGDFLRGESRTDDSPGVYKTSS